MTNKNFIKVKGGCWCLYARSCRSAIRDWRLRVYSFSGRGFRIIIKKTNEKGRDLYLS